MKITVYGGAGTIGGNKVHVDLGDRAAFLDFGESFDIAGRYCTEYLRPRPGRGLRDHIKLGLLPALDCYREDLYPVDLSPSDMAPIRVDALFLSHAHSDHYGSIGFLKESIPVVSSPMTYAILRAYGELGRSGSPTELFEHTARESKGSEPRVLVSPRGKEKEMLQRRWVLTGGLVENPGWRKGSACRVEEGDGQIEGIEYRAFPVDHSVYGATAFALRRGEGDWVVYSGDLRMHGANGQSTRDFASSARELEPKVLIVEGTRLGRRPPEREMTEALVRENCRAAVEEGKGLTIADFSANNFERLDTFIDIARRTGKRMVVTYRDVAFLDSVSVVDGNVRRDGLWVYRSLAEKEVDAVDGLRGQGWNVADPDDIAADPDEYMLCFSFLDMTKLLDMEWKEGTYIYSNSEAYDLKQTDNLQKLMNWITLFGFRCRGLAMVDGKLDFEEGFHSSGHLASEDLWRLVSTISPEFVVPVHCAHPKEFAELCPAPTLLPEKGRVIDLDRDI